MLHLYYKWRYRRAQRAAAFKLPSQAAGKSAQRNFGSYLSQHAVRGNPASPTDQLRVRRRWVRRLVILIMLIITAWVIYESWQAVASWKD